MELEQENFLEYELIRNCYTDGLILLSEPIWKFVLCTFFAYCHIEQKSTCYKKIMSNILERIAPYKRTINLQFLLWVFVFDGTNGIINFQRTKYEI